MKKETRDKRLKWEIEGERIKVKERNVSAF